MFDIAGTGAGGWEASNFFEVLTPPDTRRDLCAGQTPLIASVGPNYPADFSSPLPIAFDSLMMPLNQQCFTHPPANMQTSFVAADFVSPDLTNAPGWTSARGFELQAKSHGFLPPNPDDQVRMQLVVAPTSGNAFAEADANGNFVFHSLGGDWQALSMTFQGPPIARVKARLFVPRTIGSVLTESGIAIDRVCPVQ